MMHCTDVRRATIDQLNGELAAAGRDSTMTDEIAAKEAVVRLINDTVGLRLYDSRNNLLIRRATDEEAIESIVTSDQGHIEVDGRQVYVDS